ncbi:sigma-70 family RNA polymerase sigma factor [Fulvivirgaceae bacterium BMA12]|uniref:Sigma-70 family RNA polymerase sigma factor n=1 Tax=Agaribacillus aureus TaxID=3051825 RepID=A0ABT8L5E0_9BACT|nr:sigma-70 family RNA polymerase sigma factor [Fulvivirgaceae bacterium BMA12]
MKKDKAHFLSILEKNKQIIFKVCNIYCQNREDQKDLVQDIIIQLWNSFHKYDDQYKLSTWIYRISLNVAISFYRKTSLRHRKIAYLDDNFLQIAEENDQEMMEDIKLLKQFIHELDELNKGLMMLYLDNNSYEEIGAVLNISPTNVGTKINRIKQKLKKQFKNIETS